MDPKEKEKHAALMAKEIAMHCVRNTSLEDLHAGLSPESVTGDFSDVKVIDGYGNEIPWNKLSRLGDDEMKALMIEVMNKIYTYLRYGDEKGLRRYFDKYVPALNKWDAPLLDEGFMDAIERANAVGQRSKKQHPQRLLNHFQYAVLNQISQIGTKAHAARITEGVAASLEKPVSLAQVYITLRRMEKNGLVSSQLLAPVARRGGRSVAVYTVREDALRLLDATRQYFKIE